MPKRKVQIIRGSYYIILPKHLCDAVGIRKSDTMDIEYENNQIVMTPVPSSPKLDTGAASQPDHGGRHDHIHA